YKRFYFASIWQISDHRLTSFHKLTQIPAIILFFSILIVINRLIFRIERMKNRFMQHAKIIGVERSAAIAQIIQIITDRLKSNNKPNRFIAIFQSEQRKNGAAFTMKRF